MESDNVLNLLNNLGKTKMWIKLGCCQIPLSDDIDLSTVPGTLFHYYRVFSA